MIDATSLLLRSAGVKTYTYEWIRALGRARPEADVRLFPLLSLPAAYDHEHSPLSWLPTHTRIALLHLANLPRHPIWTLLCRNVDIFHCSNQVRNPPRNTRLTATIHDMTCWLMPELHSAANVRADANYARQVLKRAHGLIAVSENSRRDAIRLLGIPEDRIVAIYPGIASQFFDVAPDEVARVRRTLGLERNYVLSLGTIEPRKNTDRLLKAWAALRRELRDQFELVFAGPMGWAPEAARSALEQGRGGIRYLGYVPQTDVAGLTAGAAVLAYPSLYEGFGFPVAQAMASGVAVVTSNVSSMPELAGEAAIYADPKEVDSIRDALQRTMESEQLRVELGRRGRERSGRFRWEECARRTWAFWDNL